MPDNDPYERYRGSDDPGAISMDHFFQLVLMHEKTWRAWMTVNGDKIAPTEQQERLAKARAELLQLLSAQKKMKK